MSFDLALIETHWPELWSGFLLTLGLSAAVIALSTIVGLLLALARQARAPVLGSAAACYVNVCRALPVLVILYFTFYALPQVAFSLSPVAAAILGLTLASSAYLSEDIRGGLRAVDPGQWQAARALGLPYAWTIRRIILPQAFRIMIAPYVSRAIIIVKGTSVAGIVAVSELTGQAYGLISTTYHAAEFLVVAALLYLAVNAVLAIVQAWIERRWARPA